MSHGYEICDIIIIGCDDMPKYTGRQIAVFTDIHGLLYRTIAILNDIKKRN